MHIIHTKKRFVNTAFQNLLKKFLYIVSGVIFGSIYFTYDKKRDII